MTAHSTRIRVAVAAAAIASLAVMGNAAGVTPPAGTSNGAVVTGGVTEEARDDMLHQAGPYNLRLAFAEKDTGAYLANVKVTVADQNGRAVIDVVTEGPWLFAQVPPGTYTVRADGAPEQRVTVGAAGNALAIVRFPPQP